MIEPAVQERSIWAERPAAALPADELDTVLVRLIDRLTMLTEHECPIADSTDELDSCLGELRRFVTDDLGPIVRAMQVRVHPALRDRGLRGISWQAAVEHARLLRLADQVAVLQARRDVDGSTPRLRTEVRTLQVELAAVAGEHLARERRVVTDLLRRIPLDVAARIVTAAHRTAQASAHESARNFDVALL